MTDIKKIFNSTNLIRFILFTFIASSIYVTVRIFTAPSVSDQSDVFTRVKGDYIMILIQCLAGTAAILLPSILRRAVRVNIPTFMVSVYALFLYGSVYLGEVRFFYHKVPHWDTVLHTCSGAALCALGFVIAILLNRSKDIHFSISPIFVAMFAFCFALTLGGVIWELYEYAVDGILDANMQTYASLETGVPLVGRAALTDTMKDLFVDAIGAFTMSVIGYISLKYKRGWLYMFQLKHSKKHQKSEVN